METKDNKVLIFPNSRGRAEEVAVKLRKISEKLKGHPFYFSHHSSVDKELREYVEHFAKSNQRYNFCISCTSTLELGIDIGTVDEVVQIDATHSIASLIQRVGRSGRREGEKSVLFLYATNKWSLLQSLACWLLYQEDFIEPIHTSEKPFDILLHQILSIVKQNSGCRRRDLVEKVKLNFAFCNTTTDDIEEIIDELLRIDFLELIERDVIIGVDGERVVNSREFYSVFKTEPNFKVVNSGKSIGEIPFTPQIKVDENILLAARIWKIVDIDFKSNKMEVVTAKDGKKPLFFGTGGIIHPRVREKMFEVLFEKTEYQELDQAASDTLQILRKDFSNFPVESLNEDRLLIYNDNKIILYSFQGTKVNRSFQFLLNMTGMYCTYEEHSSTFEIPIQQEQFKSLLEQLLTILEDIDFHLENSIRKNPTFLDFSKWGGYLPMKFQIEILKDRYFDFVGVKRFLAMRFISA